MNIEEHKSWAKHKQRSLALSRGLAESVQPLPGKVLEFGSGFGWYTKVIRDAFPGSHITGFDKFKMTFPKQSAISESPSEALLDEHSFGDLLTVEREELFGSFDLICLGSYMQPLCRHFSISSGNGFRSCLEKLSVYGKAEHSFVLSWVGFNTEGEATHNTADHHRFLCLVNKWDLLDPFVGNSDFGAYLGDTMQRIGYSLRSSKALALDSEVTYPQRGCQSLLENAANQDASRYTSKQLSELQSFAARLDSSIAEYGMDAGNLTLQVFRR